MSDDERCRQCGRSLAPAAQFCGGCGNPVAPGESLTTSGAGADTPTMAIPTAEVEPPPGAPEDPFDDELPRRLLPWITAFVVAAVIAVSLLIAASSGDTHTSVASSARRGNQPIVMPAVETFMQSEAVSLLEREGIVAKQITVKRVPSQHVAPGTVLQQVPQPGISVTDRVLLTVSRAPDKMPDFVGGGINAARVTLSTLDVNVTVESVLNAGVSDGRVLAQSPAAGAPFAKAVTLTVARKPIRTNLGDLTATGTEPTETDAVTIAGTAYADSLIWDVPVCPGVAPISTGYVLGDQYLALAATAGLSSATQDPADRVRLEISLDGTVVLTRDLDQQTPVPIDIDVKGRRVLVLTFTPVGGGDPKCVNAQATLGRARLLYTAQSR